MSPRLVFFGTEDFSTAALQRLITGDYSLLAAVTKPDAPAGRGQSLKAPPVKLLAEKAGLKVFQPAKLSEVSDELAALKPTHGVLSAYGKLVPPRIINLFPGGIINIHPSLLPKYRGPSPIETAILNGDTQTGISLMKLSEGVDEGPVYAQKKVTIPPDAKALMFVPYMAEVGADFLMEKLGDILNGSLQPTPQDDAKASYTRLFTKADGQLERDKPAEVLDRQVRAFARWPRSRVNIHGHDVVVTTARVAKDADDGDLILKVSPGWLEIVELIAPSGRSMAGADFIRGYRKT